MRNEWLKSDLKRLDLCPHTDLVSSDLCHIKAKKSDFCHFVIVI